MRARLGTALAVLGALGAIAAGSLTATASAADSYVVPIPADQFDVVSAAASPANPDQLTVVVDSLSPVAGLTAQFLTNDVDTYDEVLTLASTVTDPTGPAGLDPDDLDREHPSRNIRNIRSPGDTRPAARQLLHRSERHLHRLRHRDLPPAQRRSAQFLRDVLGDANRGQPQPHLSEYLDGAVGPGHPDEPGRHARHGLQFLEQSLGAHHRGRRYQPSADQRRRDILGPWLHVRGQRIHRGRGLRRCSRWFGVLAGGPHRDQRDADPLADGEPRHRDLRQARHGSRDADRRLSTRRRSQASRYGSTRPTSRPARWPPEPPPPPAASASRCRNARQAAPSTWARRARSAWPRCRCR